MVSRVCSNSESVNERVVLWSSWIHDSMLDKLRYFFLFLRLFQSICVPEASNLRLLCSSVSRKNKDTVQME